MNSKDRVIKEYRTSNGNIIRLGVNYTRHGGYIAYCHFVRVKPVQGILYENIDTRHSANRLIKESKRFNLKTLQSISLGQGEIDNLVNSVLENTGETLIKESA